MQSACFDMCYSCCVIMTAVTLDAQQLSQRLFEEGIGKNVGLVSNVELFIAFRKEEI